MVATPATTLMPARRRWTVVLIALALTANLLLVTLPRFDRHDWGIARFTNGGQASNLGDAQLYINFVRFFRHEMDETMIVPPWNTRPLVPWLASLLPAAPMTALNLVNLFALWLAIPCLYGLLRRYGVSPRGGIVGCLLYINAFPMFYYGAIGYIDPFTIALLIAGLYFLEMEWWAPLGVVLLAGPLAKEVLVLLWPTLFLRLWLRRTPWPTALAMIAVCLISWPLRKYIMLEVNSHAMQYVGIPKWNFLLDNLRRPQTVLSVLLSFGLPGFLTLFGLPRLLRAARVTPYPYVPLFAGFITSLLMAGYLAISVNFLDGRIVWTMYPFAIPLAVLGMRRGD